MDDQQNEALAKEEHQLEQEKITKYRWYVLFMLTVVTTFAYLDRQLIIILQESIKEDFGLSDTQLGLLTGFAFAAAFTIFGIPVAQLADRWNRKKIMSIALAFWSGITALTGFAGNYIQLFLARVGVGIGETGSAPPALSLIADYFPQSERGRAYAIRGMGVYFGLLLGFLVGGILEEQYGWQTAFWVVGAPGVIFSIIFFFTVKEPIRGRLDIGKKQEEKAPSFLEVLRFLIKKKTVVFIALGSAAHSLVGSAFANWMPPFFIRLHGMTTAEIGVWLAFAIGVCGAFGTFLGGYLADKYSKKDIRYYLWIPAASFALSFPFALGLLFHEERLIALLFYLMPNILYAFFLGPAYAMLQDMVTIRMRATASAIFVIFLALIGGGMGPFLVGLISDQLSETYGQDSLRWALTIIGTLEWVAIYLYVIAARTLKEDLI